MKVVTDFETGLGGWDMARTDSQIVLARDAAAGATFVFDNVLVAVFEELTLADLAPGDLSFF